MKENGIDTLHLVLKHKWYDMIASGEKTEEYREYKWLERIVDQDSPDGFLGTDDNGKPVTYGDLSPKHKYVTFHRGYTSTTMTFEIAGLSCGRGKIEWGAPVDKDVIIIRLGVRQDGNIYQKENG